jgi:hypothetical protein
MIPYMHIEYEWLWLSGPFQKKKRKMGRSAVRNLFPLLVGFQSK